MSDPRLVICQECEGLGEWDEGPMNTSSHGGPADPDYRKVICPECGGTGRAEVDTFQIEESDLDEIAGREPSCPVCHGSGIEEVYGGHGTVLELQCSHCRPTGDET